MTERTSFLAEIKRRNIIRVVIAYVAVSWLVLQAAALIFQMLELSNAISKGLRVDFEVFSFRLCHWILVYLAELRHRLRVPGED